MLDETLQKKSLDIPQWIIDSVKDYQQKNGIQSFAKALNSLVCIGLHAESTEDPEQLGGFGGSEEAEKSMNAQVNQMEEDAGEMLGYPEFFRRKLNGGWGGNRKEVAE
jgi:hypothetical protein